MANQQLVDLVKQLFEQGKSAQETRGLLLVQGWREKDIDEAIGVVTPGRTAAAHEPLQVPLTSRGAGSVLQGHPGPVMPSKKLIGIVVGVFVVLLLVGGGIWAYQFFAQTPEKVLRQMFASMARVKSLEYSGQVWAEFDGEDMSMVPSFGADTTGGSTTGNTKKSRYSVDFSGGSDIRNKLQPKSKFELLVRSDSDTAPLGFGLDARTIGEVFYLRVKNLPSNSYMDLSFLENHWIKIDYQEIMEKLGSTDYKRELAQRQKEEQLTEDQEKQVEKVVSESKAIKIVEVLASERLEGVDTHHYQFVVDKKETVALVQKLSEIIDTETMGRSEVEELEKSLSDMGDIGGEIWIGKEDFLLYKVQTAFKVRKSEKVQKPYSLSVVVHFRNFDQVVQIDVPFPVKTLEEMFNEFMRRVFVKSMENSVRDRSGSLPGQQLPFITPSPVYELESPPSAPVFDVLGISIDDLFPGYATVSGELQNR
jgi:hypothetical protein